MDDSMGIEIGLYIGPYFKKVGDAAYSQQDLRHAQLNREFEKLERFK